MKTITISFLAIALSMLLNSCGVSGAFVHNHNQNVTQVHLGQKNFKVVEKITGSADVSYVFFIGGLKKKQLYANAYSNMVNSANLVSGSKAIINVVTEEHVGGVPPFYFKRTITVSAHVVEFVD